MAYSHPQVAGSQLIVTLRQKRKRGQGMGPPDPTTYGERTRAALTAPLPCWPRAWRVPSRSQPPRGGKRTQYTAGKGAAELGGEPSVPTPHQAAPKKQGDKA